MKAHRKHYGSLGTIALLLVWISSTAWADEPLHRAIQNMINDIATRAGSTANEELRNTTLPAIAAQLSLVALEPETRDAFGNFMGKLIRGDLRDKDQAAKFLKDAEVENDLADSIATSASSLKLFPSAELGENTELNKRLSDLLGVLQNRDKKDETDESKAKAKADADAKNPDAKSAKQKADEAKQQELADLIKAKAAFDAGQQAAGGGQGQGGGGKGGGGSGGGGKGGGGSSGGDSQKSDPIKPNDSSNISRALHDLLNQKKNTPSFSDLRNAVNPRRDEDEKKDKRDELSSLLKDSSSKKKPAETPAATAKNSNFGANQLTDKPAQEGIGKLSLTGETKVDQAIGNQFGGTGNGGADFGGGGGGAGLAGAKVAGGSPGGGGDSSALGSFNFGAGDDYAGYSDDIRVPQIIKKVNAGEGGGGGGGGDDYSFSGDGNGYTEPAKNAKAKPPSFLDQVLPTVIDGKRKRPSVFGAFDTTTLCRSSFRNPYCAKKKKSKVNISLK